MKTINLNKDQQRAVELAGSNILVFASAGGGKTTVLIERLLKRIIKDQISIDKIIAMTFTEAAASNLKNRLLKRLKETINDTDDEILKDYLLDELSKVSNARISTIHSFCLSIVKEYYYLAGITLKSTTNIIDEVTKNQVIDDILNRIINNHLLNNDLDIMPLLKNLSFELFAFNTLKDMIISLFNKANEKLRPFEYLDNLYLKDDISSFNDLNDEIKEVYLSEIRNYIKAIISEYQKITELDDIDDPSPYLLITDELNKLLKTDDYPLLLEGIKNNLRGIKAPRGNEEFKKIKVQIDDLCLELSSLLMSSKMIVKTENAARPLNNTLITLASELLKEYDVYKHQNETIDFNDFEHYAYNILTYDNYRIAKEYQNYYKEIMIDEFQDTNDIQFEIASMISNHNLFLVGDIKQSIYRFRGAKPGIMNSLKSNPDFISVNIRNNYRSKTNLVSFNNELFNTVMNINDTAFNEEDFQIADTEKQLTDNIEVRFDNYIGEDINDDTRATLLAHRITQEHAKGTAFKDIAVLVRSHNEKINIKKVFDNLHIPYYINDNNGYFNSYAIEILESYLKLIMNHDDRISLYSLLKSVLYNYSDDDLVTINDNPYEYLKDSDFIHDYEVLKTHVINNDFIAFFTYFLSINNFYTNYLNTKERTNFDLLINNLEAYHIDSLTALLAYIEATAEKQKENAMSVSMDDDVVRVMTIHTSKGLEFDTVFLYTASDNRFMDTRDPVVFDDRYGMGFRVGFTDYNDRIDTLRRKVINIANNNEDLKEYLRLLYVALTRPKRCLNFIDAYNKDYYPADESLIRARKGFSSIVLSIMKDNPKLELHEHSILPPLTAYDIKTSAIRDIKRYTLSSSEYTTITPSSSESRNITLNLSPKGMAYGTKLHNLIASADFENIDISLYPKAVNNLLNNDIFKEALKGDYHREYPFYSLLDNEIIHGFIDFVSFMDDRIILIDYKSDNLENDVDFINIYKPQLDGYKKVLERTYNKPVMTYIYSFHLEKMITV